MRVKDVIKKRFSFLLPLALLPEYLTDYWRYVKYSGVILDKKKKKRFIGRIIQDYHVIEKGLTMPESRQGFGQDRLSLLLCNCNEYIDAFGSNDEQVKHAVSVMLEYRDKHIDVIGKMENGLSDRIVRLARKANVGESTTQTRISAEDYFASNNQGFDAFAKSRKSIRNYSSKEIPLSVIEEVIDLARTAPSSCNKQGSRAHVYTDSEQMEKIFSIQTGNRGFGHLADKVIVVTGDLSFSHNVYERNQVYVDGGMFAMNILYALHAKGIVACPLNCYLPYSKERVLRKYCELGDSEMLVMMISCGYPKDDFSVALSHRYPVERIMTVH